MINIIDVLKNSRGWRLIALLAFVSSINILSMRTPEMGRAMVKRQLEKLNQKKQGLLIFLDDSEIRELGAVGLDLLTALYQEAGPIIVSNSLLCTLIQQREKDKRNIDISLNELVAEYGDNMGWGGATVEKNNILVSRIGFQPEQWIIKKINDSLSLLIPKRRLDSLGVAYDKVQEYYEKLDVPSEVELKLGLKVNHMKTIDFKAINPPSYVRRLFGLVYARLADYFVDSFDNMFCKKSDYNNANMAIPEWFIYMFGHGIINEQIVGLSLDSFKKFLISLETKINTQLLVVQSCYAMGVNSNKIYGEIKLETQTQYTFPIIIQGLNDLLATVDIVIIDIESWNYFKKIKLRTHRDFVSFLKKAKKGEGNYSEIIKPILQENFIENIPQIKLPGAEWFSVMDADKKIVSIGSLLAKTRNDQQPLDIRSFFKRDPEVILLYSDDIPFDLVITSRKVRAIVSMVSSGRMQHIPEFVIHRIKKISTTRSFFEILNCFKLVGRSGGSKMFFIDTIDSYNGNYKDILIFGTYRTNRTIYYFKDQDNVLFKAELKDDEDRISKTEKANEIEITEYESRIKIVQKYYSEESEKQKQEITPEQIKTIENVLINQLEK